MLPGSSIQNESAQRYWRRRANRRVRKARLTRSALHWAAVGLVHALVLVVLAVAGYRVWRGINASGEFALEHFEVEGTARASASALYARLEPYRGQNLLNLDLQEVTRAAKQDPWVLDVSAKRILPHTLRLTVLERRPCAIAMIHEFAHVVDETGFVLGPSGPGLTDDQPVLVGLDDMQDKVLVDALARGARAVSGLRREAGSWFDEISDLDLSLPDRITVRTIEGGAPVLLDPERVTRNVAEWLALRDDIARRLGPLDYVDLRWRDRITVMPTEQQLSREG